MTSEKDTGQPSRPRQEQTPVVILMGVSGSGKTSVGKALAEQLGWTFLEGDEHHPRTNVAKMASGRPLTDRDRLPWLTALNERLLEHQREGRPVILACSALKKSYRRILSSGIKRPTFVYLKGSFDLIQERLQLREDHYMKASLLESQFRDLEPPQRALQVEIDQPVEKITEEILNKLPAIP